MIEQNFGPQLVILYSNLQFLTKWGWRLAVGLGSFAGAYLTSSLFSSLLLFVRLPHPAKAGSGSSFNSSPTITNIATILHASKFSLGGASPWGFLRSN